MDLDRAPPGVLLGLCLLVGLTCQLLLGTSYLAASLSPLDQEGGVPVAVVLDDRGEHGRQLLDALRARESPIEWVEVASEREATQGISQKEYFGALVIPANFTSDLESFASNAPRAAFVRAYASPGTSTSGSLIASRAIDIALDGLRDRVRTEALDAADVGSTGLGGLTIEQGRFLAEPVRVSRITLNEVPQSGANGLAPTYLAMGAWVGGYFGAVAMERFRERLGLSAPRRALLVAGASLAQGAVAAGVAILIGFEAPDAARLALVLAAGTWMAYALVALLLDLLGLAGIVPAFAVLAFGLPASGAIYPAGLLPESYQFLHRVDPFTWLVEGLRSALYVTGADDLYVQIGALAGLAVVCAALSVAWAFVGKAKA